MALPDELSHAERVELVRGFVSEQFVDRGMVADMAIELEAMRLMVWRAASQAEQGMNFHRQAYLAKVACAEHAMKIGTDGVQLLGGHGFCREHPVEIWYRNLRAIAILDGVASV